MVFGHTTRRFRAPNREFLMNKKNKRLFIDLQAEFHVKTFKEQFPSFLKTFARTINKEFSDRGDEINYQENTGQVRSKVQKKLKVYTGND